MQLIQDYWPLLALAIWLVYKGWRTRRIMAMMPRLRAAGATLLDVRTGAEFAAGNAPGTLNIPLNELSNRLVEIPKSSPVVVACASGSRSGMAKLLLKKHGYREVHNIGNWKNFQHPQ